MTTNRQDLTASIEFDADKTSAKKLAEDLGKVNSHYAATVKTEG